MIDLLQQGSAALARNDATALEQLCSAAATAQPDDPAGAQAALAVLRRQILAARSNLILRQRLLAARKEATWEP